MNIYDEISRINGKIKKLCCAIQNAVTAENVILNQNDIAQDASMWIAEDNNKMKFDNNGLALDGKLLATDTFQRSGMTVGPDYNYMSPYTISSRQTDPVNFQRGPLVDIENRYYGPVGPTVWGTDNVYPTRRVLDLTNQLSLTNGTYTIQGTRDFLNGGLVIHTQTGSIDNNVGVPLVMTFRPIWMVGLWELMSAWICSRDLIQAYPKELQPVG